jgi:hypothetical protein
VLVVIHGERQVQQIAGQQRLLRHTLGHSPSHHVMRALEVAAVGIRIGRAE